MHGSPSPHRAGSASRILNGRDDVVIGSATAQITAHPIANFLRRASVSLVDAGDAGYDLPGRAIAALEGVALDEGGLQGMELVSLGEASMVVISRPSISAASERHDFTRLPSMRTVQAPHWPRPHPFFDPVRCRCSRRPRATSCADRALAGDLRH